MFYFETTTGFGPEPITVGYDLDDEGFVEDVEIKWRGQDVSGLLTEDTGADIEMECYEDLRRKDKQAKEDAGADRGADRYAERMAA